jgi:hypothetical protein
VTVWVSAVNVVVPVIEVSVFVSVTVSVVVVVAWNDKIVVVVVVCVVLIVCVGILRSDEQYEVAVGAAFRPLTTSDTSRHSALAISLASCTNGVAEATEMRRVERRPRIVIDCASSCGKNL